MTSPRTVLLLLIAAGCVTVAIRSGEEGLALRAPSAPTPATPNASRVVLSGGTLRVVSSEDYLESVQGHGTSTLQLHRSEHRPDDGTWQTLEPVEFSTPYQIQMIAHRTSGDLLVVGRYPSGRLSLERWVLTFPDGSWKVDRPVSSTPIGTPLLDPPTPALVAQGGTWIAPEQRTGPVRERRALIEESLPGEPRYGLKVDPDGRYLVYTGTSPEGLYRRGLAPDDEVELLYDGVAIPGVGEAGPLLYEHPDLGRALVLDFGSSHWDEVVVLLDGDNDGEFDPPATWDRSAFLTEFYPLVQQGVQDFVRLGS